MSLRKESPIKVTPNPDKHTDSREEHPAFGQISANRINGRGIRLYGSDFEHHNTIQITIYESYLNRGLSNDRHHNGKQLIEVELSEAQWATFVSSLNCGMGVQCTLRARETDYMIDELPAPKDRLEQFRGEAQETVRDAMAKLDELAEKVKMMGLPAGKLTTIIRAVALAKQEIEDNLPFVAKQFSEHMETTVERAKIEVNAYATSAIQRAGLAALAGPDKATPILSYDPAKDEKK